MLVPTVALARSGGISGYSGHGQDCTSCHGGGSTPTVSFSGPATLTAGATGTYSFTIQGGPAVVAGVDILASAGSLQATQAGTKLLNGEVVQSSSTRFSGSSVTYSFNLVAPASGTVTLYGAGLSCNGDGSTGGDGDANATFAVTVQAASSPPTIATPASANPSTVTGTTTSLSVLGADSGGEASLTYTWAATAGSGVSFSPNGTNAAKNSTATFTRVGSYTLQVTVTDSSSQKVTSSVNVTVSPTAQSLSVSPPTATVQTSGGTQQFTAQVNDQFSNPLATQPAVTWSVSGGGTISSAGLFTAGSAAGGPYVVTANSSGLTATASVTLTTAPPPTIATPASATPSSVTGTTTMLSVLGADSGGEAGLSYTWAATAGTGVSFSPNGTNAAKNSTATFTQVGSYTLQVTVTDSSGQTVTSSVNVTVSPTPKALSVSPPTATVQASVGTQQFTSRVDDQFGSSLASQPTVSWSVAGGGTINSSGLFTAGGTTGGPYVVTAKGSGLTATASVTLSSAPPPTIATPAAASPSSVTQTTAMLSALGSDVAGEAGLTYTWSVLTGSSVSFSPNGTNAAKTTTTTFTGAGTYKLQVTVADTAGLTNVSTVTVNVYSATQTVLISPPSIMLAPDGTQSFAANLLDQFGHTYAQPPAVSWSVTGGGVISSAGVFRAGTASGGPFTVTAMTVGAQGTAAVTVGGTPVGNGTTQAPGIGSVVKGGCSAAQGNSWEGLLALALAASVARRKRGGR
jgi:hypothetical protein